MAISLYELAQRVNSAMPLGIIVPYYGTDEPSGWKICDGRSCAGTDLAKKLGISVVPDLRGRFIRMICGNAAGMAVAQDDCIRNITGSFVPWAYYDAEVSGAIYKSGENHNAYYSSGIGWGAKMFFDASRVVPTGPENRPINMAFNYIIKVVGTNVILYYVSNIIYKAKAHICRTFSFVKLFQREVRNSMSISLKNHEDRIKVLENKSSSSNYSETILFDGNVYISSGKTQSFNLSRSVNLSSILVIYQNVGKYGNRCPFVPVSLFNSGDEIDIYSGGDAASSVCRRIYLKRTSDTSLTIRPYDTESRVFKIIGLTIYYIVRYNIYRLTQILLNSPFFERLSSQKEVLEQYEY